MIEIEKRIASGKSRCRSCYQKTKRGNFTIHLQIDTFSGFLCMSCADVVQLDINVCLLNFETTQEIIENSQKSRFRKILGNK
jgi:hypothetical protein